MQEMLMVDTGDTAFMIMATAMVMLMTPGLSLFYGGMVRRKNVMATLMQSFVLLALVSVQWVLWGYTLSFGPDHAGLIGGLNWLGFAGVGAAPNADYAGTIPHAGFAMFQLMFAIITPALITGAFAERMRFPAFLLFALLWTTFVYDPLAHWVWGTGGWLREMGALDFAGGTVVHISAGVSGLVAALYLGRRQGFGSQPLLPHNLPMTVLGAGLLWFGWFGFNAGSALGANGLAVTALVTTNTAAAAGLMGWVAAEYLLQRRATALGGVSGAIAGLVAITPAAGFVTPLAAILIGFSGGIVCCWAVMVLKRRAGYDDALDAFGCHGVGGIWGAVATGIFATTAVNPGGADGLLAGNSALLGVQLVAVAATVVFAAGATLLIVKLVDLVVGLRVTSEEEELGLDLTQHGEQAYPDTALLSSPVAPRPPFTVQPLAAPVLVEVEG